MTCSPADRSLRPYWVALGANAVWINASEVFRYFAFVMPMMREAFPGVDNVAPMNLGVFLVWGLWDTILLAFSTLVAGLWFAAFGYGVRQAVYAGIAIWAGVFGVLWLGLLNMNLASLAIVGIALPLALVEMVVAALITRWALLRFAGQRPREMTTAH